MLLAKRKPKSKQPGIYRITTRDGHVYVGRSRHMPVREQQHLSDLAKGKHCNNVLQSCWNKHGRRSLRFRVIKRAPGWLLPGLEAYWITRLSTCNETRPKVPAWVIWWYRVKAFTLTCVVVAIAIGLLLIL